MMPVLAQSPTVRNVNFMKQGEFFSDGMNVLPAISWRGLPAFFLHLPAGKRSS